MDEIYYNFLAGWEAPFDLNSRNHLERLVVVIHSFEYVGRIVAVAFVVAV